MIKLLLFLSAVALSQGAHKALREPHPDCPSDQHWLLPHEYDCTKFYYCLHGERFIVPSECPANTEFSVTLQVCTHIGTSGCTLTGPTASPDGFTESTSTPPSTEAPTPDDDTTAGPIELLDNGCPTDSQVHMLLPHETSCTQFYYCVHGVKVLRSCGNGTFFNPTIQICDHPQNVDCEESTEDNGSNSDENDIDNSNESNDSNETDNDNSSDESDDFDSSDSSSSEEDDSSNGSNEVDVGDDSNEEDDDIELLPNGCPIEWSLKKYLPHEYYCSKSYQCVYGSIEEKSCPVGTHFSYEVYVSVATKKKTNKKTLATLKICVTC